LYFENSPVPAIPFLCCLNPNWVKSNCDLSFHLRLGRSFWRKWQVQSFLRICRGKTQMVSALHWMLLKGHWVNKLQLLCWRVVNSQKPNILSLTLPSRNCHLIRAEFWVLNPQHQLLLRNTKSTRHKWSK